MEDGEEDAVSDEIVKAIVESSEELALVTVIGVQGSAPRHAGSKMLVRRAASGAEVLRGTVGGGKGEARAITVAGECIAARTARLLTLEFQGEQVEGQDMICGGTSRLLVEHVADRGPYRAAHERIARGERVLLVKALRGDLSVDVSVAEESGLSGSKASGPAMREAVREAARRALDTGVAVFLEEEKVFLDPVFPAEKLLILGGGYVGQAVAWHASRMGFRITVGDDRPEFSAVGRFPPGVEGVCGPYTEIVRKFAFDSATYVVMVTRGHLTDLECVRAVMGKTHRYAGFIGSARKAKLLRAQLAQDGVEQARIDALHSPIGLPIKAETPEELAISILAEIVAVRRNAAHP